MKIRLSKYIEQIEEKYQRARKEWEKLQNDFSEAEKKYNSIDWSQYSYEGQQKKHNEHLETKKKIIKNIEEIRESFSNDVESIREKSDKIFDNKYQYTPDNIDQKGIALLQVGNLTQGELMKLATDYKNKGNYTMYFLIASKLKEAPDFERDRKALDFWTRAESDKNQREDHKALDDMKKLCVLGLRDEEYLSNGINQHHEELLNGIMLDAENITNDIESPWD